MKSAEKIAKLAAETGLSKPLSKYRSEARSRAAKARWAKANQAHVHKPKKAVQLSRTDCYDVMRRFDAIASEEELYRKAFEEGDYSSCWSMRENVKNRLFGKPYVATNPEESTKSAAIYNDNRLQVAMSLLPKVNASANAESKALPLPVEPAIPAEQPISVEQSTGACIHGQGCDRASCRIEAAIRRVSRPN